MPSERLQQGTDRKGPLHRFLASSLPHSLTLSLLVCVTLGASSYFPEFYHVFSPSVGGWSRYRITDPSGETADLTFAIVAEEKGQYWLELRTVQEGAKAVAAFLVKGDPTDDENVLMVRAQDEGGPAMEISKLNLEKLRSRGQTAFGGSALAIGPRVGKLEGMPDESVTVAGKPLKCRHIRIVGPNEQTAEVWINDSVIPFGLVKLISGPEQILLTEFGKGAKSSLKGPFKPLEVP
jgi:hypothetical protein